MSDSKEQIRNSLIDEPITNDETSAYEDTLYALKWIDGNLKKYIYFFL